MFSFHLCVQRAQTEWLIFWIIRNVNSVNGRLIDTIRIICELLVGSNKYTTTSTQFIFSSVSTLHFVKCASSRIFTQSVLFMLETQSIFQVRCSPSIFIWSTDFRRIVFNPCCFRLRHFGSNIYRGGLITLCEKNKSVNLNLARIFTRP